MEDAFSKCHPAVNFLFFAGAIGFGVVIQHPAYLLAAILAAAAYYLLLSGRKGWKMILALLPMLLFLTAINPLLNHYGKTILFHVFGKPYTLEALIYGGALSGIFGVTLLWFGCYNKVLTSDKFTSLFGNLIPALSLLLVMVLRMIPNLIRKAGQISGARNSVGKGTGESAGTREKLNCGMMVLGALTSWALEGSLVTADSMRARGYGAGRRSSFRIHRMKAADWSLLALMLCLIGTVICFAACGSTKASFTPVWDIAPVSGIRVWGLAAYGAYLQIPTVFHCKEAIQWHISRSKI